MIWLIGCEGLLGKELGRQLKENKFHWVGTDTEVDITDVEALNRFEKSVETASYYISETSTHQDKSIKWIINCASYTNVEQAEANQQEAQKVNTTGALNVARIARKIGAKLIHISTDYVYHGNRNKPYTEEMETEPVNYYGLSKLNGEIEIQKEMVQYYIIRTSWLYGFDGKNFVSTMLKLMNNENNLRVVDDQRGTPTFCGNLSKAIIALINKADNAKEIIGPKSAPSFGVYNYSDDGSATWYEYSCEIYKTAKKTGLINKECHIEPCSSADYNSLAKRPAYSVLNKDKIQKELKIKIPSWKHSLENYLKSLKNLSDNNS
ncbi:MAG: dTDP-4-dehydrorhamnose reductase [Treponema sp.]|jgi:dTDP-4-dehydrorhamnose reductase|nr:dTDP-4-dehydrorhamnose reductase [Treponema sp.]